MASKVTIGGILQNGHLARISVMGVPDRPGTAAALLAVFGETGINVQFIVQCIDQHDQDHIVLCVDRSDLEVALRLACEVQAELCATTISFDPQVATLGIYGPDFRGAAGHRRRLLLGPGGQRHQHPGHQHLTVHGHRSSSPRTG